MKMVFKATIKHDRAIKERVSKVSLVKFRTTAILLSALRLSCLTDANPILLWKSQITFFSLTLCRELRLRIFTTAAERG